MMDVIHLDLERLAALAQAATQPAIDAALVTRIVSRILHILFAIILGGGLFYMRSILSPSGVEACFGDRRQVWARWVGLATFLLLATGMFNYIVIIREYREAGDKLPMSYHILFCVKFLLSLLVMFIAAILAGRTATADRFRANMRRWLNLAWTSVLAIVVIAALLRAHHVRRPPSAEPGPAQPVEALNG
jgi:uncharacterized membrane protein